MEFTYATELKKIFSCYGHFYEWTAPDGRVFPCRSVLEIVVREDVPDDPDRLQDRRPDAVAVMMNPGSSRPLEDRGDLDLFRASRAETGRKTLVLTRPDNTQYQIMRVARARGWRHVRVLNLSDLRESQSPCFLRLVRSLEGLPGGTAHSIFSPEREAECTAALDRQPDAPLLLGWGRHPDLHPLARLCLERIGDARAVFVPAGDDPLSTAHPSPMLQEAKINWLRSILAALEV